MRRSHTKSQSLSTTMSKKSFLFMPLKKFQWLLKSKNNLNLNQSLSKKLITLETSLSRPTMSSISALWLKFKKQFKPSNQNKLKLASGRLIQLSKSIMEQTTESLSLLLVLNQPMLLLLPYLLRKRPTKSLLLLLKKSKLPKLQLNNHSSELFHQLFDLS